MPSWLSQKKQDLLDRRFYHRATAYLREEFPRKTADMDEAALCQAVDSGCARASRYGLETEVEAMAFVDLQWRFSEEFDAAQWARDVLEDPDLAPDMKISTLRNACALKAAAKESGEAFE